MNNRIITFFVRNDSSIIEAQIFDAEPSKNSGELKIPIPNSKNRVVNFDCKIKSDKDQKFRCVVMCVDQLIRELNLNVSSAPQIVLESSTDYFKFPYILTDKIFLDSNYFALLGENPSSKDKRILLYKLKSQGGSKNVFYSLKVNDLVPKSGLSDLRFFLYQDVNPTNGTRTDMVCIQNAVSKGLAKIYEIKDLEIRFKMMGFYEMQDMRRVSLDFNQGEGNIKRKNLYEIFFNMTYMNTFDKKTLTFFDILKKMQFVFYGIGAFLFFIAFCLLCYCIRRERIKSSLDGDM